MSINLSELARQVSLPLHLEDPEMAARVALEGLGQMDVKVGSKHDAFVILTSFLQALLDNDLYADAARLLWKASVFTAEPQSVQNIFNSLFDESQILVQGAASTGKSFSVGVWMYLDWRRDPANTNIQIVGPSEKHLEANLFSHLINLHNTSAIPAAGTVTSLCIALDPHNKYAGIKGVVIPLGKKSAGRLQGVKVKPRDVPHPRLGKMTRLRVVLEEAENIHVGVWEDLINLSANAANKQQFKVIAAYNPKDRSSPVGIRAEPIDGWGSVDIDSNHQWYTKRGWKLVRLDGLKTENVVEGWEKYAGLQTKTGLEALTLQAGGMNTAGYYTMARGWYPEEGLDTVVIPPALLKDDQCRGEYIFMEEPENVMAVDSALEGGDNTVCMLGRFGRASGYKKLGTLDNLDGNTEVFRDSKGNRTYRSVLQVDQIVMLPKGRTEDVSQAILKVARGASVRPEWLGIDRTGNGAGVHDMIRSNFGDQVHGINGSTSSTEMRILSEDMKLPCDEYNLLYTELWFALKKWLEVGVLKFAFNVPSDPMFSELMGRRYLQPTGNPRVRVEPKAAYKSRGSKSPDRADALTMLLHVVRLQTSITQSFRVGSATEASSGRRMRQRIDITSTFETLD